jgi:hypothetical protein
LGDEYNGNLEGDLVLVHHQEKPTLYARIEAIEPDVKKDWYRVTLFLLTIPAQSVTWILREEYINGTPFTMGGQSMRLEGVAPPGKESKPGDEILGENAGGREDRGKIIPFKKPP